MIVSFRIACLCLLAILFFPLPNGAIFAPISLTAYQQNSDKPRLHRVARKRKPTRTQPSVLIKNLRYHRHSAYTRLVFDLRSHIHYSEIRDNSQSQATILLKRSTLSRGARAKLKQKSFPKGLHVSELPNHTIQISLDLTQLNKYTVRPLTKPHRLVLDLYYSPNGQGEAKKRAPVSPTPPRTTPKPTPGKRLQELLVVIDPGHGGKDPGAIGRKGTQEKYVTLAIAKILKDLIKKQLGAHVFLTREHDRFLSLEDRVQIANKKKADVFISIHVNSHPKKSTRGLELYHFGKASDPRALEVAARENGTPLGNNAPPWQFILADKLNDQKIDESRDFAWTTRELLIKTLKKHYTIKDHGVKTAPFYVLRFTTMPSILAEVAFVSNPTEENRLRNATFQRRMAEGIFTGIKAYVSSRPFL